ncbi:hypothetical protein PS1_033196 [Malus domestica]
MILIAIQSQGRYIRSTASGDNGGRCGGSDIGSSAVEEGEEAGGGGRLLLVKEEVLGNPKGAVSEDDCGTHEESGDEDGSNGCEEDDEDGEGGEAQEGLGVRERAAEDDEGLIGGAEEVEEEPGGEEAEEDEEGKRVGEEGNSNGEGENSEVVDAEVGVVLADADGGVGEGFRLGEGGSVEELGPGAALGEAVAAGVGDVVDEGAEGGGSDGSLGLGRAAADGCCGCRDREDRRGCRSRHFTFWCRWIWIFGLGSLR